MAMEILWPKCTCGELLKWIRSTKSVELKCNACGLSSGTHKYQYEAEEAFKLMIWPSELEEVRVPVATFQQQH